MERIVVNSDDFGIDFDRDIGIFFGATSKVISSISVLVTNKNSYSRLKILIRFLRMCNKKISIGLHLNLTDEDFLTCTLSDICGQFDQQIHPKIVFWERAVQGKVSCEIISKEIEFQIIIFKKMFGFIPSHIDGHNHCHISHPDIYSLVKKKAAQQGIEHIRIPDEKLSDQLICRLIQGAYANNKEEALNLKEKYSMVSNLALDDVIQMASTMRTSRLSDIYLYRYCCSLLNDEEKRKNFAGTVYGHIQTLDFLYETILNNSNEKITELMVHPGLLFPIKHKTWFSSKERVRELTNLYSLKKFLRNKKIAICNHHGIKV
jgi:predicted glycoside hydrolase/deacetylase ChbG (UPF0249 family)